MISCVDCAYKSADGLLHHDPCRLMILQFIHMEGPCEFPPLTGNEVVELAFMENEMERRGAVLQPDGYFGKCVIEPGGTKYARGLRRKNR